MDAARPNLGHLLGTTEWSSQSSEFVYSFILVGTIPPGPVSVCHRRHGDRQACCVSRPMIGYGWLSRKRLAQPRVSATGGSSASSSFAHALSLPLLTSPSA